MKKNKRPKPYHPRVANNAKAKIADFNLEIDSDKGQRHRQKKSRISHATYVHSWVAISTLGQLSRTPLSSMLTAAVIAIALALPSGLYVLLDNVRSLVTNWDSNNQISLFLKSSVDEDAALKLARQVQSWREVSSIEYVSAAQALIEFRKTSGFGDVLDNLEQNPLPAVIIVQPKATIHETARVNQLAQRLRNLEQVDIAQLDMTWLSRLNAIIQLGERGLLLLVGLFGVAILLVVGNTIRLIIFNRREEILVSKLIGATNQFIRRPFLYCGIWYGLAGALLAWILVEILLALLSEPVSHLAILYGSQFSINHMRINDIALVLGLGIGLGFLGSWFAVGRHLHAIEPK